MAWDDIREWAERSFDVPIEGRVLINLPKGTPRTPASRRKALHLIEAEASRFCVELAQALATARETLGGYAARTNPRSQILPWLPFDPNRDAPVALAQPVASFVRRFDVDKELAGQGEKNGWELARITVSISADLRMKPITIAISVIELSDGSLWAFITGALTATVATLSLMLAAVGPPFEQDFKDIQFSQEMRELVKDEVCAINSYWKIDAKSLRGIGGQELNFEDEHISAEERKVRVCNVQLMLAVIQGTPFDIDGIAGPQTRRALKYFAEQYHLPADIRNEQVRGQLVTNYQDAARRWQG